MRTKRISVTALAAIALVVMGVGTVAAHGGDASQIHACVTSRGTLRIIAPAGTCRARESALDWSIQGPAGPQGPQGPRGETGPVGPTDPAATAFLDRFGSPVGTAVSTSTVLGECLLGTVILTASQYVPRNYTPADGRVLRIAQEQALFSLLWNRYGGDGVVTFALPDLRQVAPDHMTYAICTVGIYPAIS